VVRDFEAELCRYTGAPYAVTVNSCTMALLLAVSWHIKAAPPTEDVPHKWGAAYPSPFPVEIPKRTYVSVPQSIIHAGGRPTFRDDEWWGLYQLKPLPVWDSARWFSSGMYRGAPLWPNKEDSPYIDCSGQMVCVSFHWSKTLGIQQGGAILHDNAEADAWLRRARFDGRTEGVAPKDDTFDMIGWHAYMSPEIAAEGLVRLSHLPKHNEPLPNSDYPDLSLMECFR
jgi:dTDP-4-amino-4,6-dideoxygalactose transaminase